jgi:hypothetical protein
MVRLELTEEECENLLFQLKGFLVASKEDGEKVMGKLENAERQESLCEFYDSEDNEILKSIKIILDAMRVTMSEDTFKRIIKTLGIDIIMG